MKLREKVIALHKLGRPEWEVLYRALLPEDRKWCNAHGVAIYPQIEMQGKAAARLTGFKVIDKSGRDVTRERTAKQ